MRETSSYRTGPRLVLGQRKRVASQLLLKEIQDVWQAKIALAVAQHRAGATFETIERARRQRTAQSCQHLATRDRATEAKYIALVRMRLGQIFGQLRLKIRALDQFQFRTHKLANIAPDGRRGGEAG